MKSRDLTIVLLTLLSLLGLYVVCRIWGWIGIGILLILLFVINEVRMFVEQTYEKRKIAKEKKQKETEMTPKEEIEKKKEIDDYEEARHKAFGEKIANQKLQRQIFEHRIMIKRLIAKLRENQNTRFDRQGLVELLEIELRNTNPKNKGSSKEKEELDLVLDVIGVRNIDTHIIKEYNIRDRKDYFYYFNPKITARLVSFFKNNPKNWYNKNGLKNGLRIVSGSQEETDLNNVLNIIGIKNISIDENGFNEKMEEEIRGNEPYFRYNPI